MKSVLRDHSSADCCSAATADEKKQGWSVCIRGEDGAESVAINEGRVRMNSNTTRQSLIRAEREGEDRGGGGEWED